MTEETKSELLEGLRFVHKHNISPSETVLLIQLVQRDMTAKQLHEVTSMSLGRVQTIVSRLKLKNVVELKDKDDKRRHIYSFAANN